MGEKYACVCIDYEARADLYQAVPFAEQTLASMGAHVVTIEPASTDGGGATVHVSTLAFRRTFPTLLTDEAWAAVRTTSSDWWAKQPAAFQALKDDGHVCTDASTWYEAMCKAAEDYIAWETQIEQAGYRIVHARDTSSSDAMRHAALLSMDLGMPPPYAPRGDRYGQVKEWNLHLTTRVASLFKEGKDELKAVRAGYPVQHTHIAHEDAHHAAYELKDLIVWLFEDTLSAFQASPHAAPSVVLSPDASARLFAFLGSL